jgi:hypothetical protein
MRVRCTKEGNGEKEKNGYVVFKLKSQDTPGNSVGVRGGGVTPLCFRLLERY